MNQRSDQVVKKTTFSLGQKTRVKLSLVAIALLIVLATGGYFASTVALTRKTIHSVPHRSQSQGLVTPTTKKILVKPTSIPVNAWVTIKTFVGDGTKKTTAFTVPIRWRLVWSCDLSSHKNKNYDVIIHAHTKSNSLLDDSIETTCSKNNTHSSTEVHQGGNIYLSIISEGYWKVLIQNVP